jgi:hypothetical protein
MAGLIRLVCAGTLSMVVLVGCSDPAAENEAAASPEVATIAGTAGSTASQPEAPSTDVSHPRFHGVS